MTENNQKSQEELFLSEYTYPVSFLPQHIHLTSYHFNLSNYKESLYQTLNIHCPQSIQKSVIKRQAEYLAGRYATSMVFQPLHMPISNVLIGSNRSPIWPQGMVASISHSSTIALCAAALDNNYQYLGIDIERRLSLELVTEIKKSIINNNEEDLLLSFNNFMSFTDAFTLVFSAKESLFKALHPQVNSYFDFSAAELLKLCNKTKQFELVLLQDLSLKLKAGTKFTGNFYFDETHVTTLIAQ
ncbi:MAG: enterobactin synthetase component D [Francisellaceae bacterium]|jgi:enterobactin synthetase component D